MINDPQVLARKAEHNIHSIEFLEEYSDDHIPCAKVNVTLVDGSIVENVDLMYVGSEGVAALRFTGDPKAVEYIRDNLLQMIFDNALCEIFDGCNDENTAKIMSLAGETEN